MKPFGQKAAVGPAPTILTTDSYYGMFYFKKKGSSLFGMGKLDWLRSRGTHMNQRNAS